MRAIAVRGLEPIVRDTQRRLKQGGERTLAEDAFERAGRVGSPTLAS